MPTEPELSYLILTTPRSGSTLLCEALQNTGVAGVPEEYYQHRRRTGLPRRPREYFEGAETLEIVAILGDYTRIDDEPSLFDPRRFPTYRDYLDWTIRRATTPNGVFGAKVMWGYFNGFLEGLRDVHGNAVMSTRAVLERSFPNLRGWILLTRGDKVRQAVSLWKAIQDSTWRRDEGDGHVRRHDLRYSFDALDHLAAQLARDEQEWRWFLRDHGIVPHELSYEDVVADYEGSALAILDRLGIERPAGLTLGPRRMRRQSDGLSDEWVERYRADAAARGPAVPA